MSRYLTHITDNNIVSFIKLLLIGVVISSCSMTKHVPDGKYLLNKNHVSIDNKDIDNDEVDNLLRQKPNKRILGFMRFHLGVYNLSSKTDSGWFSRTSKKIGEEPVIYDNMLTKKSCKQIDIYLKNKGYYNAEIKDTAIFKKKTVKVYYTVKTGKPYYINSISYHIDDTAIYKMVSEDTILRHIKPGELFDIDKMQEERTRIETNFKIKGYYNFSKEYIYFEADSNLNSHKVNLTLNVKNFVYQNAEGNYESKPHSKYKIGEVIVMFDNTDDLEESANTKPVADTVVENEIKFLRYNKLPIKPTIIAHNIYINPGQIYSSRDVEDTYRNLNSLKVFKFINIQFTEIQTEGTEGELPVINCVIRLATQKIQSYQTEVEFTNSLGMFGVGGSINYQHKNLFRGAEQFDLKLKGATEAIKNTAGLKFKNTLDLGVEGQILIPKFLLPFKTEKFIKDYNPKTTVSLSYNYLRRPVYTYSVANIAFGYFWKGNKYTSFQVNPIDINFVKMIQKDSVFFSSLSEMYQRSFTDHLVSVTSFSYTYNNQKVKKNTQFKYFRGNLEFAGNTFSLFNKIFNSKKGDDNTYRIFNIKYAQYVKADVDYHFYQPVNETDKIVYRAFIGVAYPYGNSSVVPFEKQYFAGGAYGIRAWPARGLGPGAYRDTTGNRYPSLTADLKLESNIEYRFKLIWIVEGAFFLDAGNIWDLVKNEKREKAFFKWNSFYKQIAVGTGFGTRFDLSFFMLRFDLGMKLRDPSLTDHPWTFGKKITSDYFYLSFGISYPF